jgi:(S)-ureidoglycine aminohydrolase
MKFSLLAIIAASAASTTFASTTLIPTLLSEPFLTTTSSPTLVSVTTTITNLTPTLSRPTPQPPTQSDTLIAQAVSYHDGQLLKGPTHDLALLDIRAIPLRSAIGISARPDTADVLLIVKEGELNLTIGDSTTTLDPGGVALIPGGLLYNVESDNAVYYRLRFKTRGPAATEKRSPFVLSWSNMPVHRNSKGETRQIFSLPTTWLSKIDLHATTLNPGEVSHPPHTHRTEEIILLRTGNIEEYIHGKHYPATDGALIFLPSGNPHAVENHSTKPATYFALQWQP